jgi:26S proteasome regulatory subunit N3
VCAKAIRDGVIDAVIDHATSTLCSAEVTDIYSTIEPQKAFHKRIQFCMGVHDDAMKAMRYPPDAHKNSAGKKDGEGDDGDENKTEEEIAKEIEAELEEDEGL